MRDLVLVGGGHAHVFVLKSFGLKPVHGVRLTLVTRDLDAPYSGMLPGLVAGIYPPEASHIDLRRLAAFAGARLVHGEMIGLDRSTRRIDIRDQGTLGYDVLSIDVGITPQLGGIEGAADHGFPVKPVSTFWPRWADLVEAAIAPDGPRRFVVVGGGAAGFELVLGTANDLRRRTAAAGLDPSSFQFTLVAGGSLLKGLNWWARRHARHALAAAGIEAVENDHAVAVGPRHLTLRSGRILPADATVLSTGAAAPQWFEKTGLDLDAGGFLAVRPTLQSTSDPDVFAAGDCAGVLEHPRPKAGVFAVRQGEPLTENLRRRLAGELPVPFRPQRQHLTILSEGNGSAIAARGPLAARGRWVFWWKDHLDRHFIRRFKVLPESSSPHLDEPPKD